jgi:hypothetical protein
MPGSFAKALEKRWDGDIAYLQKKYGMSKTEATDTVASNFHANIRANFEDARVAGTKKQLDTALSKAGFKPEDFSYLTDFKKPTKNTTPVSRPADAPPKTVSEWISQRPVDAAPGDYGIGPGADTAAYAAKLRERAAANPNAKSVAELMATPSKSAVALAKDKRIAAKRAEALNDNGVVADNAKAGIKPETPDITLLTGYPGAGKTTFLKNMMKDSTLVEELPNGRGSIHETPDGKRFTVAGNYKSANTAEQGADKFRDVRKDMLASMAKEVGSNKAKYGTLIWDDFDISPSFVKHAQEQGNVKVSMMDTPRDKAMTQADARRATGGKNALARPAADRASKYDSVEKNVEKARQAGVAIEDQHTMLDAPSTHPLHKEFVKSGLKLRPDGLYEGVSNKNAVDMQWETGPFRRVFDPARIESAYKFDISKGKKVNVDTGYGAPLRTDKQLAEYYTDNSGNGDFNVIGGGPLGKDTLARVKHEMAWAKRNGIPVGLKLHEDGKMQVFDKRIRHIVGDRVVVVPDAPPVKY